MDAILTTLGLGVHIQNRIGWFPPIILGFSNALIVLLGVYYYVDKMSAYKEYVSELNPLTHQPPELQYDFIVVGSGSAGSVVANRLSKHFSVLLLEMGGRPNPLSHVPGMEYPMLSKPEMDHMYLTVPQNNSCLSHNNHQNLWNAGLGFGGCSILNAMAYVRGHPFDYNGWAKFTRDERWNYDNVLPYFKRTEHYCDTCDNTGNSLKPAVNRAYHGFSGEFPIRPCPFTPIVPEFLEALNFNGIKTQDFNAPYFESVANVLSNNIIFARRITSFNAFVDPVFKERPNLRVLKYAQVIRVIFKPGTTEAIGVEYDRFGNIARALANKEVILSAGTMGTPKILLLSGIGPAQELAELGIPSKVDLPVGRNLQDHVGTIPGPFLLDQPVSIQPDRDMGPDAALQWVLNGTGTYAVTSGRAMAFWSSDHAIQTGEGNWPDVVVGMGATGISHDYDLQFNVLYNIRPEVTREYFDPIKGRDAFSMLVSYGRPKSRGTIRLKSADYKDPPLIDPGYYTDPENLDIKVIVQSLQKTVFMMENSPSMRKLGCKLSPVPWPTCKHVQFRSPEYWECLARQYTLTLHHFVGTASFGPRDSPLAVVDPELRVIGVQGLRVMDASVEPILISGNTAASAMMIAERGSDLVIKTWLPSGYLSG